MKSRTAQETNYGVCVYEPTNDQFTFPYLSAPYSSNLHLPPINPTVNFRTVAPTLSSLYAPNASSL